MCVTTTSRITVSIILVVITTVKERRVVAILILHSNVTSVDILIRHWMESATMMIVVAFTFALMATDSRRCAVVSCDVSSLLPEMVENRHRQVTMSVPFESQPSQAIYSGCLLDIPVYWAILHLMYWYCIGMGILHTGPPNIPIKPGVKYIGSHP